MTRYHFVYIHMLIAMYRIQSWQYY